MALTFDILNYEISSCKDSKFEFFSRVGQKTPRILVNFNNFSKCLINFLAGSDTVHPGVGDHLPGGHRDTVQVLLTPIPKHRGCHLKQKYNFNHHTTGKNF